MDPGNDVRVHPIRFGEHHVEGDQNGPHLHQVLHQLGDNVARPRPLADLGKAVFVQIDDGDRLSLNRRDRPRFEVLVQVECFDPDELHGVGIGYEKHHEGGQQADADQPINAEDPPQGRFFRPLSAPPFPHHRPKMRPNMAPPPSRHETPAISRRHPSLSMRGPPPHTIGHHTDFILPPRCG